MTRREYIALRYLSDKMEATANMIGKAIVEATKANTTNYRAVAAPVLGALRERLEVFRVRELNAWQITVYGRAEMKRNEDVWGIVCG